ncbi:MAG: thiamine diphosphokinase [Sphaerochaetaceae bacterium]|nr:thiamine diphosphokinase [Sphaerochaetaceae bacterium]
MNRCALVITGGNAPSDISMISSLPPYSYVCAADSGLDTAYRLGLSVDFAIGDFDSVKDLHLLDDVDHKTLSVDKDDSDTEALLSHLIRNGFDRYILIGGGEGRFDHLLHLYTLFQTFGPPLEWITAKERMLRIDDVTVLSLPKNTTVSVIPAFPTGISYISCQQMRWPLVDYLIDGSHMSLSNRTSADRAKLHVTGDPVFLCINGDA